MAAEDDDELVRRRSLTFEEAEGLVPLPSQLELGEVTPALRARLWEAVHLVLRSDREKVGIWIKLGGRSRDVMRQYCVEQLAMMADEISDDFDDLVGIAKRHYLTNDYGKVLGFTQWFLRERKNLQFAAAVELILVRARAPYRLVDGDTLVPIATEQEGEAFEEAVANLAKHKLSGARKHLLDAAAKLTEGAFADSVRECVHAVESMVRTKTGTSKFSDGLVELNKRSPMHASFRSALVKLYGYASDEEGIRHPLLEQSDAKVTERDALFILGVCSSFVTYLLADTGGT